MRFINNTRYKRFDTLITAFQYQASDFGRFDVTDGIELAAIPSPEHIFTNT